MHVLISSYEFDLGSEGICTGRLVRALVDAGCQVTVVTSPTARTTFAHEHLRYHLISPYPQRPSKLFFRLAPLLGHLPTRFCYVWSRRAARLRLEKRPDLIYGRANPFQSVAAAHGLASRNGLTLWTHLSDPMPSPFSQESHPEYQSTLDSVRRLARESQVLTFTTQGAVAFQETMVGELGGKAFVLNHVAPEPAFLPRRRPAPGRVFAYFGLFYGARNATGLLRGFCHHQRSHPEDRLLFVGTDPQSVIPEAGRLGIAASVQVMERVDNVREVMAKMDVLVATDSFLARPVFLSTKLVEYLVVNRPILLLSPAQSPGATLLRRFPETTRVVSSERIDDVSAGLAQAAACVVDDSAYRQRFAQMDAFSARSVAELFLQQARVRNRNIR
jgi:hypothetical protein